MELLKKRETAGVLIGAATLAAVLSPPPLLALILLLFSYALGWELERITARAYLRWIAPLSLAFSIASPPLGLLVAATGALFLGYAEVKTSKHYSLRIYATFTTALLAGIYAGVMPSFVLFLREISAQILLALVFTVWVADTAAYYGGRLFGSRPFFREISPKKTLEGFLTGVLLAAAAGSLLALILKTDANPLLWLSVALAAALGDLFESFIKRSFGVKDSSNLLGSHGGLLDRFDGMIFAATFLCGALCTLKAAV